MEVDARLKAPFTAMVAGPTGSGKTVLMANLIKQSSEICSPPPDEIIYCYGVWQERFKEFQDRASLHKGMIDVKNDIPQDGRNRWLIIDDLMQEISGNGETNSLYTKYSHHLNISVFFIVQNLFVKSNRTVSLNSHYFFIFKNPRDSSSISHLARQAFPRTVKAVQEAYADATRKPYSFLLINLRQETDERIRLIGNFASQTLKMEAYVPK